MPKAFLFDLDQTLIDRTATVELFVKDQYVRVGVEKQHTYETYLSRFMELDQNGYADKQHLFRTLRDEFDLSWGIEQLVADFYNHAWKSPQLFADAEDTLKHLREAGYKLAIITNGSSKSQRAKLNGAHLPELVDTILVSGEEKIKKPNPEIFLRATQHLNVEASDCVFIGDNPQTDILGAYKVGMTTVWMKQPQPWADRLDFSPDYTINGLNELLQIQFE